MPTLEERWNDAVNQYRSTGGKKTISPKFGAACRKVDSGFVTFRTADPNTTRFDPYNTFAKAVTELEEARNALGRDLGTEGLSISVHGNPTPGEALRNAADGIVTDAQGARQEAYGEISA